MHTYVGEVEGLCDASENFFRSIKMIKWPVGHDNVSYSRVIIISGRPAKLIYYLIVADKMDLIQFFH